MAVDNRIVKLGREEAVKAIENTEYVYVQIGCWNRYELYKTADAIATIRNLRICGYGADVWKYKDTFRILIPTPSDMW